MDRNDYSALAVPAAQKSTLGNHIRDIVSQLRQEEAVQIKATSRILGAAAKLADNQDRLIDEVVDMVEEDLNQQAQQPASYTVKQLQQQFKKLGDAKSHFGIKASSWANLVAKLNEQNQRPNQQSVTVAASPAQVSQDTIAQRFEIIEQEMQMLRSDVKRVVTLLEWVVEKLS